MSDEAGYADAILQLFEKVQAEHVVETQEGAMCCCILPSHPDDSTPSFAINTETGLWRCYGCKESGNLAQLISRIFEIDVRDAIKQLAKYETRNTFPFLEERGMPKSYSKMDERVLIPYQQCPQYMLDRGFKKKFLRRFEIGFDSTAGVVTFPVRSIEGHLAGVTRRTIFSDVYPKYRHSRGWLKSDFLYLGNHARETAEQMDHSTVVFVEGHVDALRMWSIAEEEGGRFQRLIEKKRLPEFSGAPAIMGSSMSARQVKIAVRHLRCRTAIFAFDNDRAGEEVLYGTETRRQRKKEGKIKGPVGAIEALLTAGVRSLYRLRFDEKDPGDLTPDSRLALEDVG